MKRRNFLIISILTLLSSSSSVAHDARAKKKQFNKSGIELVDELISKGKYDDALAQTELIEKKHGNTAEIIADRALAFMYKGNMQNALHEAESALKIDSSNHEAHWVLANVYSSQGLSDQAMKEQALSAKYKTHKRCKPCLKTSSEFLKKMKEVK